MTKHSNYQKQKQQGFTLLELLVVVSILAAVSMTTSIVLNGLDERTDAQLTQVEMAQVAKAVRQFRADTGYFPKEGPFSINDDVVTTSGCDATLYQSLTGAAGGHPASEVVYADLPAYSPADCDDRLSWFYSAANMSQLTGVGSEGYLLNGAVMSWDAAAGRGWRGPYLGASGEGFVDMGDIVSVADNPLAGGLFDDVPSVMAGSPERPQGAFFLSRNFHQQSNAYLAGEVEDRELAGRPILMFIEKGADVVVDRVVVLSMGADGIYSGYDTTSADICEALGDDQVICIYPD